MKDLKFMEAGYKGKPFTQLDIEEAIVGITGEADDKRTVCNVLRLAYQCLDPDAHNMEAARSLILEAFWMGKRMHSKLSAGKQAEIRAELDDDDEEFAFSVNWELYQNYPARGNYD